MPRLRVPHSHRCFSAQRNERRPRFEGERAQCHGFHPELSGYENARVAALIAGLSDEEFAARADEIFAFAELGDFLQAPVRTYSAGMTVRLGFAVAVHLADVRAALGALCDAARQSVHETRVADCGGDTRADL